MRKYNSGDNGRFYKKNRRDKVYWFDDGKIGPLEVSFDKVIILNLWQDYPHNFTAEQKELFDRENKYWAKFFKSRTT